MGPRQLVNSSSTYVVKYLCSNYNDQMVSYVADSGVKIHTPPLDGKFHMLEPRTEMTASIGVVQVCVTASTVRARKPKQKHELGDHANLEGNPGVIVQMTA